MDTWKALEKLLADGKVRAIGVSNFLVHHLEDLLKSASVRPVLNQVEFHPFLVQKDLLEFDARSGIRHEAWSPLTRGRSLGDAAITAIARKHGRTNAQVLLRWDLQLGVVTIPNRCTGSGSRRTAGYSISPSMRTTWRASRASTPVPASAPNPDTITF